MSSFGKQYSSAYNLLYENKDYGSEVDFVLKLLRDKRINIESILDLGCGTGRHDFEFAKRGFRVVGVDRSDEMLRIAQNSCEDLIKSFKIEFVLGDVRSFRTQRKFDAVVSLFAVASYQIANSDLLNFLNTARAHLEKGGIFVFDAWNGNAVLRDAPKTRIREIVVGDNGRLIRITEPALMWKDQVVDVNFRLMHIDNKMLISETVEAHKMRYFFLQEISLALSMCGFSDIEFFSPYNDNVELKEEDFNFLVRAIAD